MEMMEKTKITVEAVINAPVEKVWKYWTEPAHVTQWNQASDDWHCPGGKNDLKVGGRFSYTMAAKDGSMSFEFGGVYTALERGQLIAFKMDDDRTVEVTFTKVAEGIKVTETFEAEETHSLEMQQGGWQAILNNFKTYTENN